MWQPHHPLSLPAKQESAGEVVRHERKVWSSDRELVDRILANKENGVRISWLNRRKMIGRFLTAPLNKRQIVDQLEIPTMD